MYRNRTVLKMQWNSVYILDIRFGTQLPNGINIKFTLYTTNINVNFILHVFLFGKPISDYHYSELTIQRTNRENSGNYSCVPSNAIPAFVLVHIFKGKYHIHYSFLSFAHEIQMILPSYIFMDGFAIVLILAPKHNRKRCERVRDRQSERGRGRGLFQFSTMSMTMPKPLHSFIYSLCWPIALTTSQILLKWIAKAIFDVEYYGYCAYCVVTARSISAHIFQQHFKFMSFYFVCSCLHRQPTVIIRYHWLLLLEYCYPNGNAFENFSIFYTSMQNQFYKVSNEFKWW